MSNGRCGRWRDHRQVIDGILHRVRTGVQWRDLLERFGPWKTVYERHRLWSADGTWEHLLQQIQAAADAAGDVDWDVSVDSTSVRAHQHAAGARNDPPPTTAAPKGGRRGGTPGRTSVAEPGRPTGGGGSAGEALGRSRGGFTSKIHLSADGRCRPLSLLITAGQRSDSPQFRPLTRPTATGRVGSTCDAGASRTRSRRRPTAGPPACEGAHTAAGHRGSTRTATRSATPSNEPSTGSRTTEQWPPAMTSVATFSSAPSRRQASSSGSTHDRPESS